jgi:hypothetical protein
MRDVKEFLFNVTTSTAFPVKEGWSGAVVLNYDNDLTFGVNELKIVFESDYEMRVCESFIHQKEGGLNYVVRADSNGKNLLTGQMSKTSGDYYSCDFTISELEAWEVKMKPKNK